MKILIVDDEKFNLVMAQKIIEEHLPEADVVLCNSPHKVFTILETEKIDVILLDIVMPDIDGVEILKQIRGCEEFKDIQILMFTGIKDKDSFRICFENGADDYISKPINLVEFVARLRAALNTRINLVMLKDTLVKMAEQYNTLHKVTNELKEAQFYLVQKEKLASLGELAAGVAHEINNPLGFVASNLETISLYLNKIKESFTLYRKCAKSMNSSDLEVAIAAKNAAEEYERKNKIDFVMGDLGAIVKDSREGTERVAKIVRSLRNFAYNGNEEEMTSNDLHQIIEEVLLIAKNETKYVANIEKSFGVIPPIRCEKSQIGQVLLNLLINAAQAIKEQQRSDMGHLRIETYVEGPYAVCKVQDDGPGIAEEHLGKIFDPFFTTKEVGSGTGLGLSIAYGIIKRHNGEFSVESKLGQGAAFTMKIPLEMEALEP
ncbi:MAG: response regulator [Pelosinus sp.]|nr:response regulator [Pelosinus sp.]